MTRNTDNYLETVGKVTEVQEELNDENSKVYDTSFTYTVDGKEYTGVFEDLSKERDPDLQRQRLVCQLLVQVRRQKRLGSAP